MNQDEFQKIVLENFKEMNKNFEEIKTEIKSLKTQVNENTQILKALEHKAEVNKAEIDNISVNMAHIQGDLKSIRDDMSTVEVIAAKNNLDIAKLKAIK